MGDRLHNYTVRYFIHRSGGALHDWTRRGGGAQGRDRAAPNQPRRSNPTWLPSSGLAKIGFTEGSDSPTNSPPPSPHLHAHTTLKSVTLRNTPAVPPSPMCDVRSRLPESTGFSLQQFHRTEQPKTCRACRSLNAHRLVINRAWSQIAYDIHSRWFGVQVPASINGIGGGCSGDNVRWNTYGESTGTRRSVRLFSLSEVP